MKLWEIAHSRTGDKGNISDISLIVYDKKDYDRIRVDVTADKVKAWFDGIVRGDVVRYEIPSLGALNFVLYDALGGGVTRSLSLDKHGKSLSAYLLDMEIPEENALSREIEEVKGYDGIWQPVVAGIARTYDPEIRNHDTIFYGASNFWLWKPMEEDLAPFSVQNHAFGGSTDKDLMFWAPYILYPYSPKIVFFQTGSNDYVESPAETEDGKIAEAMDFKHEMFTKFHENLPNATFVVMSGILLPGRSEYVDMTLMINDRLREYCAERDYMLFVDAEALTYDRAKGSFVENVNAMFLEDQIHLTDAARIIWANTWMRPLLQEIGAPVKR